jgi:hypothetical protein
MKLLMRWRGDGVVTEAVFASDPLLAKDSPVARRPMQLDVSDRGVVPGRSQPGASRGLACLASENGTFFPQK